MLFKIDNLPDKYKELFIADGGIGNPNTLRSPWFDKQQKKRTPRDFHCNINGTPYGSSDSIFDAKILAEVKKGLRFPDYEGALHFTFEEFGEFDEIFFDEYAGNKNLKWWGRLFDGRPDQTHNYIIGSDLSFGRGSSNSVSEIYDVNMGEQVGELADPNIPIEQFADLTVALANWVGGVDEPFLIWESNGGQGESFKDRVIEHGYTNVYTQTREDSKTRKQADKYGWRSFPDAKEWVLSELNIALGEGLKKEVIYNSIKINSREAHKELTEYMFSESGSDIVSSTTSDLSTGARKRHGDRVIALALCILGCREQGKGELKNIRKVPFNSFEYFRRKLEEEKAKDSYTRKRYLF